MVIEELDGVVNGAIAGQQVIDIAVARAVSGGGEGGEEELVVFPIACGAPMGDWFVRVAGTVWVAANLAAAAAGIFPAKVSACDGKAVIAISLFKLGRPSFTRFETFVPIFASMRFVKSFKLARQYLQIWLQFNAKHKPRPRYST